MYFFAERKESVARADARKTPVIIETNHHDTLSGSRCVHGTELMNECALNPDVKTHGVENDRNVLLVCT
jgi:hypothetical protein